MSPGKAKKDDTEEILAPSESILTPSDGPVDALNGITRRYEKSHQEEHQRERSLLLQKAVKLALRRKVANKVGAEE